MDLPIRGAAARACAVAGVCVLAFAATASASHPRAQMGTAKGFGSVQWSSLGLSAPSLDRSTASSAAAVIAAPRAAAQPAVLPPPSRTSSCSPSWELKTPDCVQVSTRTRARPDPTPARHRPRPDRGRRGLQERGLPGLRGRSTSCKRGGFFSVDIPDPANPVQLAFVPALPGTYHGEGAHAITFTRTLPGRRPRGQQRAVRREPASAASTSTTSATRRTRDLVPPPGTRPPDSRDRRSAEAPTTQNARAVPHSTTRSSSGSDGAKVYLWRRQQRRRTDVDIFDITEPAPTRCRHGVRPSTAISRTSTGRRARRLHDPARHGRQGDRRRPDAARLLLGRGLRQVDIDDPANSVHRRQRLRDHGSR